MAVATLTGKRRQILEFIADHIQRNGYPPSVREIGEAVGLSSSSTVHTHLQLLQREGFLRRDPTKPRTLSSVALPLEPAFSRRKISKTYFRLPRTSRAQDSCSC